MDKSCAGNSFLSELISPVNHSSSLFNNPEQLKTQESQIQNGDMAGNQSTIQMRISTQGLLDIHKGRPIKLQVKVLVPVKDHPNFNFVGKLLGPKGNSLKRLQEETQTKMAVLGRGSMRDKNKEEELRQMNDPKFSHLFEDLHVEITAFAPAAEAYSRMAVALTELKPFLVPDYYDEIRQTQLRELAILNKNRNQDSALDNAGADQLSSPSGEQEALTTPTSRPPLSVYSQGSLNGRDRLIGGPSVSRHMILPGAGLRRRTLPLKRVIQPHHEESSLVPSGEPVLIQQRRPVLRSQASGHFHTALAKPVLLEENGYAYYEEFYNGAIDDGVDEGYMSTSKGHYDIHEEDVYNNGYHEEWTLPSIRRNPTITHRSVSRSNYRDHPYPPVGLPHY